MAEDQQLDPKAFGKYTNLADHNLPEVDTIDPSSYADLFGQDFALLRAYVNASDLQQQIYFPQHPFNHQPGADQKGQARQLKTTIDEFLSSEHQLGFIPFSFQLHGSDHTHYCSLVLQRTSPVGEQPASCRFYFNNSFGIDDARNPANSKEFANLLPEFWDALQATDGSPAFGKDPEVITSRPNQQFGTNNCVIINLFNMLDQLQAWQLQEDKQAPIAAEFRIPDCSGGGEHTWVSQTRSSVSNWLNPLIQEGGPLAEGAIYNHVRNAAKAVLARQFHLRWQHEAGTAQEEFGETQQRQLDNLSKIEHELFWKQFGQVLMENNLLDYLGADVKPAVAATAQADQPMMIEVSDDESHRGSPSEPTAADLAAMRAAMLAEEGDALSRPALPPTNHGKTHRGNELVEEPGSLEEEEVLIMRDRYGRDLTDDKGNRLLSRQVKANTTASQQSLKRSSFYKAAPRSAQQEQPTGFADPAVDSGARYSLLGDASETEEQKWFRQNLAIIITVAILCGIGGFIAGSVGANAANLAGTGAGWAMIAGIALGLAAAELLTSAIIGLVKDRKAGADDGARPAKRRRVEGGSEYVSLDQVPSILEAHKLGQKLTREQRKALRADIEANPEKYMQEEDADAEPGGTAASRASGSRRSSSRD